MRRVVPAGWPAAGGYLVKSGPYLTHERALTLGFNTQVATQLTFTTISCRFIPDKLLRKKSVPRTASCIVLSAVTLVAALLNALQKQEALGIASLLSGFAFGGFQGVVPAITSEIFGLRHFATNYAMVQLGPAVGKLQPQLKQQTRRRLQEPAGKHSY